MIKFPLEEQLIGSMGVGSKKALFEYGRGFLI